MKNVIVGSFLKTGVRIGAIFGLLVLAGLVNTVHAQSAQKKITRRALLVGIEAYPKGLGWELLEGARADVEAFRIALIERTGFEAKNVHVLLDEQATRAAILKSFASLAGDCGPDDMFLFYFAGHGSQLNDQPVKQGELSDESDGLDETLIPYDTTGVNGVPNDIRDDDLKVLIRNANTHTENIVLVFDCCSAGTNVRGGGVEAGRFVSLQQRGIKGVRQGGRNNQRRGEGYLGGDDGLSYVSLSACLANQVAHEFEIDTGGGVMKARGVFTYFLLRELYATSKPTSYRDLINRVSRSVDKDRQQTPTVSGPLDMRLAFHGGLEVRPHSFRFTGSSPNRVLNAGSGSGIVLDSRLEVFPDEASLNDPDRKLGTIQIVKAEPTSSRYVWNGRKPKSAEKRHVNWRALLLPAGSERSSIGVYVEGKGRGREGLIAALESVGGLRQVKAGEATYHLRHRSDSAGPRWQTFTATNHQLPPSARDNEPAEFQTLANQLRQLSTYHSVLSDLQNDASEVLNIEVAISRVDAKHKSIGPLNRDASGAFVTRDGDLIRASLTNNSPRPIYVSLFVLSPDGEIRKRLGFSGADDRVWPGKTVVSPILNMELNPKSRNFYKDGAESFRWFVTTKNLNLDYLEQDSITDPKSFRGGLAREVKSLGRSKADILLTRTIQVRLLPKKK